MNSIGGFFELELNRGEEYHPGAIKLNLGRASFEYLLRAKKIKKVIFPFYTCNVLLEPLKRTHTEVEFYHIDENLEPKFDFARIGSDETFIYTNYFGVKGSFIKELSGLCPNLIIDNSQAFFEKPLPCVDTIYSPRKFFGVPDGGYLYTDRLLSDELPIDHSITRFSHLLKRIEEGAEEGYEDFRADENKLNELPIKQMSVLTKALLRNINYEEIIHIRKQNFSYLHEKLNIKNELDFLGDNRLTPMVYPFLIADGKELKRKLIDNKVYIATYWPDVEQNVKKSSFEYYLVNNLVNLPIDQRYTIGDMNIIFNLLK